jgi:putative acetyltransferase
MTRTPPGLRPYLPTDAHLLAALFRASIETLAEDYYSEDQLAAWASVAHDEAAFGAKLAAQLTLVGVRSGEIAGFATLKDNAVVDMLYVHPAHARAGVASALVEAVEKLAAARGATTLTAEASDAARDFFAARGYEAQRRNMVALGDEWLGNTTMTKALAQAQKRPQ